MTYCAITYARKLAAEGLNPSQIFLAVNAAYPPITLDEAHILVNQWAEHKARLREVMAK
mgnify:CR=1 FL=1